MGDKSIRPGYWHEGHYLAAAPETERLDIETRFECDTCHKWPQWRNWSNHMAAYRGHRPLVQPAAPETERTTCASCFAVVDEVDAETGECRECFDLAAQPAAPETERLREALRAVLLDFDSAARPKRTEAYLDEAERIFRAAIEAGDDR